MTDERDARLEARLARIERALGIDGAPATAPAAAAVMPTPPRPATASRSASNLMGWGAALSFVLAALYFIKLVYAAGWLTPDRQLGPRWRSASDWWPRACGWPVTIAATPLTCRPPAPWCSISRPMAHIFITSW